MRRSSDKLVIIGAGQSGLAAARAALEAGLTPLVFESGAHPVGSWPRYYDSLRLFSPARHSALPGRPFPADPGHYPSRDEVAAYLAGYAAALDADIRTGHPVELVRPIPSGFEVIVGGRTVEAAMVIAATGAFSRPYRPRLPGVGSFTGAVLHAADYRSPQAFAGQRIVVVGGGNSAVQIAIELAASARVTLATRHPLRFLPQRLLGHDVHRWLAWTRLDTAGWAPPLLTRGAGAPVLDTGAYRARIATGNPDRRPMFTRLDGAQVVWGDGGREAVDTLLLATGYRPDVSYLSGLDGALDGDGLPRHRGGLSLAHPGLGYVGLEWQRSFASATLRGVGADAAYVLSRLRRRHAQHRLQVRQGRGAEDVE